MIALPVPPAVGVLVVLVLAASAWAQPAPLRFDHFSLEEGFSDYVIMALARDADDFLWVGTQDGVNRFDGIRVRVFRGESGGAARYVTALRADRSGGMWVATRDGYLSHVDARNQLYTVEVPGTKELPRDAVRALALDGNEDLWVGLESSGLCRLGRVSGECMMERSATSGLPSDSVLALLAAHGSLWVGTNRGLARRDAATGAWSETVLGVGALHLTEAEGHVWAAGLDGGIYRVATDGTRAELKARVPAFVSGLAHSPSNPRRLWVGTRGRGVLQLDLESGALTPVEVTENVGVRPSLDVISVLEDRFGLLWVGTLAGLYRADVHGVQFSDGVGGDVAERLSRPAVMSLYEASSEPHVTWVASIRGGLNRIDRRLNRVDHHFSEEGHPLSVVFAMHEDRQRRFWLGATGPALYELDRRTMAVREHPLPTQVRMVNHIIESPSLPGVFWLSTRGGGLVRFDPAGEAQLFGAAGSDPGIRPEHLWMAAPVHGTPDELWLATLADGLHRVDLRTGRSRRIESRSGCQIDERIVSVAQPTSDVLWIGTFSGGLLRFDTATQACRRFTRADGLSHDDVGAILPDARGRLWLSTSNGLTMFDPRREAFTRFTEADGLQGRIFHYYARHASEDGALLFGGSNGFNRFDPLRVAVDTTAPRVTLTRLLINGRPYPIDDAQRTINLRHDQNDIVFEFAALDLRRPGRNQYRVRLDGADQEWRSSGPEATERYPLLPPGRYTFRVTGSNGDGYWSPDEASLSFFIRPPLWRTWYFWSLIGGLIVGAVAGGYQYRIRQLLRLERTRRRIADDLHDDIGSKISTVALRLELAGRSRHFTDDERVQFSELSEMARTVVNDLRDAVWVVDAGHDDLASLAARMEQFTEQMLRGRRYTFEGAEALPPVPVPMERRRHLYLLFKEAVHNAVRHGRATDVTVSLRYEDGRLTLEVQDDGCGFDPETVRRGRGLSTLQQRAEALGGVLRLHTVPGRGTTVRLETALE